MSSLAFAHHPGSESEPVDLTGWQRVWLSLLVVGAHAGAAAWWWQSRPEPAPLVESAPIMVSMVPSEAPLLPVPPQPKPLKQSAPPAPAAPPKVVAAPRPILSAAPSPAPAPMVVPAPVVAAPAPTPAPAAAPAVQSTPAAAPAGAEVSRAPAQPREFHVSAVTYLVPPVLTYPRVSRELGESGIVLINVLVDELGRPREIQVLRSSGYPRLDQQAVQAMRAARFKPYVEDGVPRSMWVKAPQKFLLEE